jgi:hypothetical protein
VLGGTLFLVWIGLRLAKWRLIGVPLRESTLVRDRFELLDRAADSAPPEGLWLEFGVFWGASINHIAGKSHHPITGFDSFEGLPKLWTPGYQAGDLSTGGSLPSVRPEVSLVKGWFDDTLPLFLQQHPNDKVAFLHVDSDLCESARTVLNCLGPRITKGTVIVFDEFCGWMPDDEARAWREFCRSNPLTFEWLGCCLAGSVSVKVTSV